MNQSDAIMAFAALAQDTRLRVFRLLVSQVPEALAAGDIAHRLDVNAATLSSHLAHLERANLVTSRRNARHIFYRANIQGAARLVNYLTQDCCQGRPDICRSTLPTVHDGDQ